MPAPEDKNGLVYLLFLMHGLGILMPWNIMINAYDYFNFKLKVDSNSEDRLQNYKTNFMSYLGIASKAPNLLFQIINMFIPKEGWGSLSSRMLFALVIQLMVMIFTTVLAAVKTDDIPEAFFWMTMISNAVMNVGGGIYQSSAFGSAGNMPLKYINALSLGINLSGVVVSIFDILSKAIAPDPVWMAVIYFMSAIAILIICIVLETKMRSNEFRVYYQTITENEAITEQSLKERKGNPYIYVFYKIFPELTNIFLVFFVSFSIFPSVMASIVSSDNWLSEKYFTSVFCFLVFQSFTFLGTITAEYLPFPTKETMIAFTSLRLMFIPFYLFFDYRPEIVERKLPVLLKSDLLFLLSNAVFGFTNGHLPALTLMVAPNQVPPEYSRIAGMMSALMILVGILSGFYFSLLFPKII